MRKGLLWQRLKLTDALTDDRINDAIEFWRLVNEADNMNRSEALNDIKFAAGEQWPVEIQNSRNLEARPCLTINKIDAYVRQVTNQQRMNRPRIKVHPVDNGSRLQDCQSYSGNHPSHRGQFQRRQRL